MGEVKKIKTYSELKEVCLSLKSPWLKKYLESFFNYAFWMLKGYRDYLPKAQDTLLRLDRLLKKYGYTIDDMALLQDLYDNYVRPPEN